jgi:hypothetical protein
MLHRVPNLVRSLVPSVASGSAGAARSAMSLTVWLVAAAAALPVLPAGAQTNTPAPAADQQAAPSPDGANIDQYSEAQSQIAGPAGNPECVRLGSQVLNLLQNNDIDTAFRYLDLYDRFGCPGGHIQAAYRCFLLHPVPMTADRKSPDQKVADLDSHIRACWVNPAAPAVPAATPAAAPAAAAAAPSAAAPSQTSTH